MTLYAFVNKMALEEALDFNFGNLMNCVQYENVIWNPAVTGSEEAWRRIAERYGFATSEPNN